MSPSSSSESIIFRFFFFFVKLISLEAVLEAVVVVVVVDASEVVEVVKLEVNGANLFSFSLPEPDSFFVFETDVDEFSEAETNFSEDGLFL